jgi:hypothetical protein
MNAFVEHHKDNIQLSYRCCDRLLLNGLIQPFQQPERVLGFFNRYREGKRVTRKALREIADQFQDWVKNRSEKWGAPILEPSDGDSDENRRDRLWDAYFQNAKPNQVVAILKAREPARILVAIGDKDNHSPHLEYKQRRGNQFNFYRNDARWGRMLVRLCPYFPFSARVCLNQHHWLAIRMTEEGIDLQQSTNASCGVPTRHDCKNWPTRSLLAISCSAGKSGWPPLRHTSPTGNANTLAASIVGCHDVATDSRSFPAVLLLS